MADFSIAYNILLKNEGGYQSIQADNGNYACGQLIGTNYGISAPTLQTYLGRCPSLLEMVNLPESTAKTIYQTKFWDAIRGNEIENQNTANMLVDMYVNHPGYFNGIVRDAVTAQRPFIMSFSLPFDTAEIGIINGLDQKQFFDDVKAGREAAYYAQAQKAGQQEFLNGWLNRLKRLEWNETWKQPIKFGVIAVVILLAGLGVYLYVANRKKMKA